jgi:hypothetical protein
MSRFTPKFGKICGTKGVNRDKSIVSQINALAPNKFKICNLQYLITYNEFKLLHSYNVINKEKLKLNN